MHTQVENWILYEDNHLLVINKPAGWLVQADKTGDTDLMRVLKAYLKEKYQKPGEVYLGLVHRLDRPVSGVMVWAKTSKAAARLSEQFRTHQTDKRYLALVEGVVQGQGSCQDFLLKEHEKVRVVSSKHPKGLYAKLDWTALAQTKTHTVLGIVLETGRPHQIRIQLGSRRMPIVGDLRYGGQQVLDGRNLALHCHALTLEHPTQRLKMKWEALPPVSWHLYISSAVLASCSAAHQPRL